MRKFTKRSAALVTAGVLAATGGAAYAWTLFGTGFASATASTVEELDVEAVESTPLVPGSTADVKINVINKNAFPVEVTGIAFKNFTSPTGGCASHIEFVSTAGLPNVADLTVPAKDSSGDGEKEITYAASVRLKNTAPDACKGATFNFAVDLDAQTVGNAAVEDE